MSESLIFFHLFFWGVGRGCDLHHPHNNHLEKSLPIPSSPRFKQLGLSIIKAHTTKDLTHVIGDILPALEGPNPEIGPNGTGPEPGFPEPEKNRKYVIRLMVQKS